MRAPIAASVDFEIVRQLVAEAAADIAGNDAHIFFWDVERAGEALLRADRQLRRRVHGQLRAVPHRHRRLRLHRRLMLIGRGIGRVDFDGSVGEGRIEVTDRTIGRLAAVDRALFDGGGTSSVQIPSAASGRIANAHRRRSCGRLLKRVGNDKGDGKAEIRHVIVVKRRHGAREAVRQIDRTKRMLRRRIVLGQHEPHARRFLCILHIHRSDATFADRGGNNDAVEGGALRSVFVRVLRLAGHLEATIDTIEGKSDWTGEIAYSHCRAPQMVPVTSAKAARSVRRASGILKLLWP